MKTASIMSVRVTGAHQFGWVWRAEDGPAQSRHVFRYFFDCTEDARKAGYACRFSGKAGNRVDATSSNDAVDAQRLPEAATIDQHASR